MFIFWGDDFMREDSETILDITNITLTPGNNGNNCLGNGEHVDENGNNIECCCDECDYYLQCFPEWI